MPKTELSQTVGKNIRYHRECSGLSQNQAAEDIGIPQFQWWGYESGYHLSSVKTLEKICDCLGVSSAEILGF